MLGIVFAFCCLAGTSLNDFVFKLFVRKERSKGLFVSIVGVIWLISLLWLKPSPEINWSSTIFWGCISGICSAGGNILLIEGMARQSVGLCSLIYRLNMILVVAGGALFLHERPTVMQYAGIFFALLAIVCYQLGNKERSRVAMLGILLVVLASVMRAGMGLSFRYGFLHGADANMVSIIDSFFWIFGGLLYMFLREGVHPKVDRSLIFYGIISGIFVAMIVIFMAYSLYYGEASVVIPLAQMSFIVTFLLGRIFLKEPFGLPQIFSMISGIVAIVLLSLGGK